MIALTRDPIDPSVFITRAGRPESGAIVSFVGIVRDDNIEALELESYEDAAVADLTSIADDATRMYALTHVDIVHRIGRLAVGDPIVLIVVSAAHREEAFQGCSHIIDRLKQTTPIWKKEISRSGDRWIEGEAYPPPVSRKG